jgi:hypothetical protein
LLAKLDPKGGEKLASATDSAQEREVAFIQVMTELAKSEMKKRDFSRALEYIKECPHSHERNLCMQYLAERYDLPHDIIAALENELVKNKYSSNAFQEGIYTALFQNLCRMAAYERITKNQEREYEKYRIVFSFLLRSPIRTEFKDLLFQQFFKDGILGDAKFKFGAVDSKTDLVFDVINAIKDPEARLRMYQLAFSEIDSIANDQIKFANYLFLLKTFDLTEQEFDLVITHIQKVLESLDDQKLFSEVMDQLTSVAHEKGLKSVLDKLGNFQETLKNKREMHRQILKESENTLDADSTINLLNNANGLTGPIKEKIILNVFANAKKRNFTNIALLRAISEEIFYAEFDENDLCLMAEKIHKEVLFIQTSAGFPVSNPAVKQIYKNLLNGLIAFRNGVEVALRLLQESPLSLEDKASLCTDILTIAVRQIQFGILYRMMGKSPPNQYNLGEMITLTNVLVGFLNYEKKIDQKIKIEQAIADGFAYHIKDMKTSARLVIERLNLLPLELLNIGVAAVKIAIIKKHNETNVEEKGVAKVFAELETIGFKPIEAQTPKPYLLTDIGLKEMAVFLCEKGFPDYAKDIANLMIDKKEAAKLHEQIQKAIDAFKVPIAIRSIFNEKYNVKDPSDFSAIKCLGDFANKNNLSAKDFYLVAIFATRIYRNYFWRYALGYEVEIDRAIKSLSDFAIERRYFDSVILIADFLKDQNKADRLRQQVQKLGGGSRDYT